MRVGRFGVETEYRVDYPFVEVRALRNGVPVGKWEPLPFPEVLYHLYERTVVGRWLIQNEWPIKEYLRHGGESYSALPADAITIAEAAARFGVTAQALHRARSRHPDTFPAPCATKGRVRLYRWQQLRDWRSS